MATLQVLHTAFIIIVILRSGEVVGATDCIFSDATENDVIRFLKDSNSNYTVDARPVRNNSSPVIVYVSLMLYRIRDFVEQEGTLLLDGYIYLGWSDDFMRWNSTYPYNCVKLLIVEDHRLWRPLVTIGNGQDDLQRTIRTTPLFISSPGDVELYAEGMIYTHCEVDVTYFPFDYQYCKVKLDSFFYETSRMKLRPYSTRINGVFEKVNSQWSENREWEIVANSSRFSSKSYSDADVLYDRVVFRMLLKRKPLFYYMNVILPSVIISVVETVTFALPNFEVAKMSISVTCLLAYSVFQGMIINDMPRSGDKLPLLCLYINLQMAFIAVLGIIGEGIVFLIARAKGQPSVRVFQTFKCFGSALFFTWNSSDDKANNITSSRWMYISSIISRANAILYWIAIVVTPIIMFFVAPAYITIPNVKESNFKPEG